MEDNQGITLTKIGYSRRLMSFFFLKGQGPNLLKNYVTYGEVRNETRTERTER